MRRHPWLTAAIVFFLLCVGTFFAFEWHSEKRWQRYAAEARARGVKLSLADFQRPPIPDDVNFAKLPMWRQLFAVSNPGRPLELPERKINKDPVKILGKTVYLSNFHPDFGDPIKSKPIDWNEWQHYFLDVGFLTGKSDDPLRDVLSALDNHYAPEFQQWREWHTRTQCQFPFALPNAEMRPMPQLTTLQDAEKLFLLRMRAHQALKDSGAAYADFQDGLQACRSLRDVPGFISGLVRMSILYPLLGGVGDGCRDHVWTEEDYRRIETDLADIRVWDDWSFTLASERANTNAWVERWLSLPREEREKMIARFGEMGFQTPSKTEELLISLYPRGLVRDNQYRQNCFIDELLARVNTERQTVNLNGATPSAMGRPSDGLEVFHYFLILSTGNVYREMEARYIRLQTRVDQARLACALERFRAQRGGYPVSLSELVPEFLAVNPTDIYAGAPYHYQRVGDTSFRLYGVGKNGQDDGGLLSPNVSESRQPDEVWPYAPTR